MTSNRFIRSLAWVLVFVLVAALVALPPSLQADQPQPFYDELGRLVGVVDGQGNVAVYTYDAVGNLLPIQRFTSSGGGSTGTIGIFFFTPSSGPVGTPVTINGFGFSSTPSANVVKFNGTTTTVSAATFNTLMVTVPTGATTGPITVTNTNGTATSAKLFTVLVPPIISGIDPPKVPQGATSRLAIAGFNLANATAVTFTQSGLTATILPGATSQSLSINLAVGAAVPLGAYAFSVTTPSGTTQSGAITVTVAAPLPSFSLARLSVFLPSTGLPSGPASTLGKASVFLPSTGLVTGPAATLGKASVFLPSTGLLEGPEFTLSHELSVAMP